jgi:hypothetical protein
MLSEDLLYGRHDRKQGPELIPPMNTGIFGITACMAIASVLAQAGDQAPITKDTQASLVKCIDTVARGNVAAARVNVTHDTAQRRVRIFAVTLGMKTGGVKEFGYDIDIIYNVDIAIEAKVGVPAYHFQHNSQVMAFAAAQIASGNTELGRRLIRLLAEAQPDLFWSSPSHPVMTIQQILTGLERDTEVVKEFLRDQSEAWMNTFKVYGPPPTSKPKT